MIATRKPAQEIQVGAASKLKKPSTGNTPAHIHKIVMRQARVTPAINQYFARRKQQHAADPKKSMLAAEAHAVTDDMLQKWISVRNRGETRSRPLRDALLLRLAPLLRKISNEIRRTTRTTTSREDLYQAGYVAILETLDTFDPEISSLQTYMHAIARTAMLREAANMHGPVRLATNFTDKTAYFHGRRALSQISSFMPGLTHRQQVELAALDLDMDPDRLEAMLALLNHNHLNLNAEPGMDDLARTLPKPLTTAVDDLPEVAASSKLDPDRLLPILKRALDTLPERTREMIELRYLSHPDKTLSLQNVARVFNRSKKTIRENILNAFKELRGFLESNGLTIDDLRELTPVSDGRQSFLTLSLIEGDREL